jgi:tetratricopeptide (TPR) repeat protein
MVPVTDMERWSAQLGKNPARDQRMMAARVVVGFDEARGVMLMHDPSFGPAWELPRAQFEAAWRAAGAHMTYVQPDDAAAVAARFARAPAYRTRTVDERAAEKYAFSYANAAVGEFATAERLAREGITGIEASDGYRHVLNLELGLMLRAQDKVPEAIRALEDALKWVNDSPVAWQALAQLYRKPGAADSRLADYAAKTGADLVKDAGTMLRLAAALPSDLVLVPFLDLRGWCGN